jgi:hypothetical protein
MKHFQWLGDFNPVPLLHEITRQPDLWQADTYLRDYPQGPFGDTETIFLRFPPASVTELERGERDQHECVWMEGSLFLPSARAMIFALMGMVQGERLGRVMINKLKMGGRIYPHADTPAHADYWQRYHAVLQSSKGCNFRCGEETIHMEAGNLYWFDNALEHEVVNNGVDDRIHMIVDIRLSRPAVRGLTPQRMTPDDQSEPKHAADGDPQVEEALEELELANPGGSA